MESGDNLDESCCVPNGPISNNAFDAEVTLRRQLVGSNVRVVAMNCCLKCGKI